MHPDTRPEAQAAPTSTAARRTTRRSLGLFAVVALTTYALDVVTKVVAVAELQGRPPVRVVGDLLQLTLVRNPGAAFGTGTSYTLVLSLIAIGAVLVVLFVVRRLQDRLWAVGLGCLLGGVLGNLTDRVLRQPGPLRGHVIDWIALPSWPVFNIADICIDVAAVIIVVQAFRGISLNGTREPRDGSRSWRRGPAAS